MWREADGWAGSGQDVPGPASPICSVFPVATLAAGRGLRPTPNRSFFTSSMRSSSALSMIVGTSPSGTRWRSKSCACRSLSRSDRLAVNCTLKVSPLSGATTARRCVTTGCGTPAGSSSTNSVGSTGAPAETSSPGPPAANVSPGAPAAAGSAASAARAGMGAHFTTGHSGSLRITTGTGGSGARRATSSSISRFDLPAACARTASWLSSLRCGASSRSPARCTRPDLAASITAGSRRPERATVIRL